MKKKTLRTPPVEVECTNGRRYPSMSEAARRLNIRLSDISYVVNHGGSVSGLLFGRVDPKTGVATYFSIPAKRLKNGEPLRVPTREEIDTTFEAHAGNCRRLAFSFSRRMLFNREMLRDDAFQSAALGLLRGLTRREPTLRNANAYFNSFAAGAIRDERRRETPEYFKAKKYGIDFHIRSVSTLQSGDGDDGLMIEQMAVDRADPTDEAEQRERLAALRAAVAQVCTEDDRQLLLARFKHNLLPAEIARRFNLTEAEVYDRLNILFAELRTHLTPEDGGEL